MQNRMVDRRTQPSDGGLQGAQAARGACVMTNEYQQPDASQAERRAIIEAEARSLAETRKPPEAGTYFGQAQADAALEAKGRFAAQQRPHIVGSGSAPPLASPEWSRDG